MSVVSVVLSLFEISIICSQELTSYNTLAGRSLAQDDKAIFLFQVLFFEF